MSYDELLNEMTKAADETVDAEALARVTRDCMQVLRNHLWAYGDHDHWKEGCLSDAMVVLTDPSVSPEERLINAITELSY